MARTRVEVGLSKPDDDFNGKENKSRGLTIDVQMDFVSPLDTNCKFATFVAPQGVAEKRNSFSNSRV
jgi:hypothetical protein